VEAKRSHDYRECELGNRNAGLADSWIWRLNWQRQTRHTLAKCYGGYRRRMDHERIGHHDSVVCGWRGSKLADSGYSRCRWEQYKQHTLVKRRYRRTSNLGVQRIGLPARSPVRHDKSNLDCSTGGFLRLTASRSPAGRGRSNVSPGSPMRRQLRIDDQTLRLYVIDFSEVLVFRHRLKYCVYVLPLSSASALDTIDSCVPAFNARFK
jgi:hypothetical protein